MTADLKKARVKARELLDRFGITEAPIPIFEIANACGYSTEAFNPMRLDKKYQKVSGVISINDMKIIYNQNDAPVRVKFTIAHELGHAILKHELPKGVSFHMRSAIFDPEISDVEKEADEFAAELLVPELLLRKALSEAKNTREIAEDFDVSTLVISRRIKELEL